MTSAVPATAGGRLMTAAGALAGGAAALASALRAPVGLAASVAAISCGIGALLAAAGTGGSRRAGAAVAALGVAGAAGVARGASVAAVAAALGSLPAGPVVLTGTVRDSAPHGSVVRLVIQVDTVVAADGEHTAGVPVLVSVHGDPMVVPGDSVEVDAAGLRPPSRGVRRSAPGIVAVASRATVSLSGRPPSGLPPRLLAAVRGEVSRRLDAAVAEPDASLLDAVVFGARRPLPAGLTADLQRSGLVHLVAVSGLKVAVVAALVTRLASLAAAPRAVRAPIMAVCLLGYVVLAGAGPAALRSAVMALAALGLRQAGRRPQVLPLLAVVGASMLLADPSVALTAGFQLTFLGTLGIVLFADPLRRRLPGPRLLTEPFAVTVAAQAATFPVTAAAFGTVSLVAPLANALVLPLLAPLLVLTWAGCALSAVAGGPAPAILEGAGLLIGVVTAVAHACAALPAAALATGIWPRAWVWAEAAGIGAALIVLRGRRRRARHAVPLAAVALSAAALRPDATPAGAPAGDAAVAVHRRAVGLRRLRGAGVLPAALAGLGVAAAVAVAATRPDGRLHIVVLDTAASPAVLVETSTGRRVLVDAGGDPQRLLVALGAALPPTARGLDMVMLTGGERSAVGGLAGLSGHYRVGLVVVPDASLGAGAHDLVEALRVAGADIATVPVGQSWGWGGATWRCLSPGLEDPSSSGPAGPLCAVQVADAGARVLIAGDMPPSAQEDLASAFPAQLRSDLLVTPPGGPVAPVLLDEVAPRHIGVPGRRSSGMPPDSPRWAVRDTAGSGSLRYTADPSGVRPG